MDHGRYDALLIGTSPSRAQQLRIFFIVVSLATCVVVNASALIEPWQEVQQLLASDGEFGDHFGYSVSLDGDVAIAGAWGDDIDGKDNQGSAYIFRRVDGVLLEEQKLVASDGAAKERFGRSVTIHGETAVVGASSAEVNGEPGMYSRLRRVRF